MATAETPKNETQRLQVLDQCNILDTAPEPLFDNLTALAARLCQTPIALVSLLDETRQWFKSAHGVEVRETPRDWAFCAHAILQPQPFIVQNPLSDPRTRDNPLVTGPPGIRFYAGVQLVTSDGFALGTLCVIDTVSRSLSEQQLADLKKLAEQAQALIESRRMCLELRSQSQELRDAHQRLEGIAAQVPGVVYQYELFPDGTSCFPYASEGIRDVYRVAPEDVRESASDVFKILHPDDYDKIVASIFRSAKSMLPWRQEYRVKFPDGTVRWLSGNAVPSKTDRNSVRWNGFIIDITDQKKLIEELHKREAELTSARALAEQANRSKSDFLANMSHEIRTPLTSILGYADLITCDQPDQSTIHSHVETIRKSGQHLLTIINDILDISKIEAGQLTIKFSRFDLPDLVKEVVSTFEVPAANKNLALRAVIEGKVPATLYSDQLRLRQILINLVGNAVKFTSAGSVEIRIRFEAGRPDRILFDVCDTGIGIAPDLVKHLFEPFTQADSSISRRFGGTGLGLVICRRLAKLLRGAISVASVPGKGSTFTLKVATKCESEETWIESLETRKRTDVKSTKEDERQLTGRVLLAEDNPENQRLFRFLLEKAGLTVEIAEDGERAVEVIAQADSEFNLVLMDIQMPKMDGYAATRLLRARNFEMPIIALTANAMTEDREQCLQVGCDDFLPKPVDRRQLLNVCEKWLDQNCTSKNDEPVSLP